MASTSALLAHTSPWPVQHLPHSVHVKSLPATSGTKPSAEAPAADDGGGKAVATVDSRRLFLLVGIYVEIKVCGEGRRMHCIFAKF